jgi:hypothetical protein
MFNCGWCLLSLELEQIDAETAFLNLDAEEEIYIQAPQGLEVPKEFKKGAPGPRL